ncbi:MAG: hypothetical protein Fur0019_01750 [Tibeticola sp.]
MQVDLPALERPTKAISGTLSAGRKCSSGAVVRKRAVCIQPIATAAVGCGAEVALGEIGAAESAEGGGVGLEFMGDQKREGLRRSSTGSREAAA